MIFVFVKDEGSLDETIRLLLFLL